MARARKRSGNWQALWTVGGSEHAKTRKYWTYRQALRYAQEKERQAERTPWISSGGRTLRFEEYAAGVLAARDLAPSTQLRDDSLFRNHLTPRLGGYALETISPSDVRDLVAAMREEGYAARTIRQTYGLLRFVLDMAIVDGLIQQTPCLRVKLPATTTKVTAADPNVVSALADAIEPRYRALVILLAGSGLRIGEALALVVDDFVWLPRPQVTVSKTLEKGTLMAKPPKTLSAFRTVSLPSWAAQTIAEHLRTYEPGPSGLVFTSPTGGPVRIGNWRRRVWLPAAQKIGHPQLTPHQLRHLHASLLFEQRDPLPAIAARMGHASPAATMAVYAHWLEADDGDTANRLSEAGLRRDRTAVSA